LGINNKNVFYGVTARHVIEHAPCEDGVFYLRINNNSGGWQRVETRKDSWKLHDNEAVDVAAVSYTHAEWADMRAFSLDSLVSQQVINDQLIGIGDEVATIGLFHHHYGRARNIPIVRIGNIAAMPEEEVRTAIGFTDAFLIESRSIGGLSGSPVFVYSGIQQRIKGSTEIGFNPDSWNFRLLGIIQGHWDVHESNVAVAPVPGDSGNQINVGIAIVTPATRIIQLLNNDVFIQQREQLIDGEKSVSK
jgi:hypothetical protein